MVPYFFKEFDGHKSVYLGKQVTSIKISSSSSLGQIMRLFMVRVDVPQKPSDHYNIYLTVEDTPSGKKYEGNFYRYESGARSFLKMPEDVNKALNELLEDIFRMAFVNFVDGAVAGKQTRRSNNAGVIEAIDKFIDTYDLLEVGFNTESMRTLYYRGKNRGRLVRFQNRPTNRAGK